MSAVFTLTIDPALLHPELVAEYGIIELKKAEQYVDSFSIVAGLHMPIRFENNLAIQVPLVPNSGNSFYELKLFTRLGQVFATFFQMPEADTPLHSLPFFNSSYSFKLGIDDLNGMPNAYEQGKFLRSGADSAVWYAISKADVGLGNVDNTSDAEKPVSIATQQALDAKLDDTQAGAAGGLATLDASGYHIETQIKASGVTAGTYPKVTVDAKGRVTQGQALLASDVPTLNQNTTGNAGTASQLAIARSISATGDASWSTSFDGSGNVSAVLTLAASGVVAGSYGSSVAVATLTIDAKGRITAASNTTIRSATTAQTGIVQLSTATNSTSTTLAATPSAVKSAYDLAAAAIPTSQKGVANGVATLDASGLVPSSQLPSYVDDVLEFANLAAFPATGTAGKIYVAADSNLTYRWTGTVYVSVGGGSGVADSAVKLYTPRNIGGVPFDGTTDINLPGVNAAGNQNTTGNAATATKLASARNINGTPFDGSGDITVADASKLPLTGGTTTGLVTLGGSSSSLAAKIVNAKEAVTVSATAATGTINIDLTAQSIVYYTTAASANFTLNVRGNATATLDSLMAIGESITAVFMNTNGATGYYANALQVDGAAITPKWIGGTAPTSGNASAVDSYTMTIIKTAAATFTVLASQSKFA